MLTGKVVVVTGAGRGLGRAYAVAAAAAGAALVVNDVDGAAAASVASEVRAAGGAAVAHEADVSSWIACNDLMRTAVTEFGRLDGLVANAAVIHHTKPWDEEERALRRIVETNVLGVQFCATHAMRTMIARGEGGSIVAITSGARLGLPGMSAYGATKGAVVSMVASWSIEAAEHGIRVNAVSPLAQTDMASVFPGTERLLLGPPEGVAPLVVALLSDTSAPITGQLYRFGGTDLLHGLPETTEPVAGVHVGAALETAASIATALGLATNAAPSTTPTT